MASRGVAVPKGLAPAQPTPGMIIVYATQSGHVALDGGAARNSPFARAFVDALGVPSLEVAALFRRVEEKVLSETAGLQSPELSISGVPEYYLTTGSPDRQAWDKASAGDADALIDFLSRFPASGYAAQAREKLKAIQGAEAGDATEALFWQSTEKNGSIGDYANYLKKYPGGAFSSIAVNRIAALAAKPQAASPPAVVTVAPPTLVTARTTLPSAIVRRPPTIKVIAMPAIPQPSRSRRDVVSPLVGPAPVRRERTKSRAARNEGEVDKATSTAVSQPAAGQNARCASGYTDAPDPTHPYWNFYCVKN